MTDVILALNAGSSSLKGSLFVTARDSDTLTLLYQAEVEGMGSEPHWLVRDTAGKSLVDERLALHTAAAPSHEEAFGVLLTWLEQHESELILRAVGHRVVQGGSAFSAPVLLQSRE